MATATNGVDVFPDDAPKAFAYNPDGTVATITVTWHQHTYVRTFTYTGGNLTGDSGWVKQ